MERWLLGVVLPVNPSTLLVWKQLQKFDTSATRQEAVSEPSANPSAAKERIERKGTGRGLCFQLHNPLALVCARLKTTSGGRGVE